MIGMGTPNSHSRIPRPIISSLDRREPRHANGVLSLWKMERICLPSPFVGEVVREARRMRGLHPRRETPHPPTILRIVGTLSHKGTHKGRG